MNIFRNNAWLIDWHLWDIINNKDSFTLARVCRFDDPLVLELVRGILIFCFQLVEMAVEVCKLIWQVISIRYDIKRLLTKLLLHLDHVSTQPVLPCQFKAVREMVDLLIFIHIVIDIRFIALTTPHDIPIVWFGLKKLVVFEHGPYKFGFTPNQFKKHFSLAFINIWVQDRTFLKVDCGLAVRHQNGAIFQGFKVDKFCFHIQLNILDLCRNAIGDKVFQINLWFIFVFCTLHKLSFLFFFFIFSEL